MSKDIRYLNTEALLRDAMVKLLKKKPFDQITTTELVTTAHISRSSFYTHYSDKYDMIDNYQQILFNMIEYVFDKNKGDIRTTLLETFEFLSDKDIYSALLSENGSKEIHSFIRSKTKELLEKRIYPRASVEKFGRLGKIYASTYHSNATFGITQAWILRGKKETPEQMAELLVKLIG